MTDVLDFETRSYSYTADGGTASRAALGLISLTSDQVVEDEMHRVCDRPGVATYTSRIENAPTITPETLADMAGRITASTRLLMPGGRLDVVAYGCTSAAVAIGEDEIFRLIRAAKPDIAATTPITGAKAAFRAFGAKRIAVLTPYRADVNALIANHLIDHGFEIAVFGSFLEENDNMVAKIDGASIRDAVLDMIQGADADAVFVSCTNIRLADQVAELEERTGLPVTSSNHAMIWHGLRLAGVDDSDPRWGKLFTLPLPA